MRNLYPMVAYKGDQMRLVFEFIAELVLRHIKAQSLPRRLWGWQQASRLIDLGRRHRWYFKAYLVRSLSFSHVVQPRHPNCKTVLAKEIEKHPQA